MGGGKRLRRDVPRRGGRDILSSVAEVGAAGAANGGSLAQAAEFCASPHRVAASLTTRALPGLDESVRLTPGNPPVVVNGGGPIGLVKGSSAKALNGCLRLNWQMVGTVDSVDPGRREIVILVAGVQAPG
jgi:hypothetical protein